MALHLPLIPVLAVDLQPRDSVRVLGIGYRQSVILTVESVELFPGTGTVKVRGVTSRGTRLVHVTRVLDAGTQLEVLR